MQAHAASRRRTIMALEFPATLEFEDSIELALTVGLVSTILGTASRAQNVGALSAVGVGGYVILAGLWSSPVSGASMNPARSFGPDLVTGDFTHFWLYVIGPLAGALIAVGFAWILRGRGGDPGGASAASGLLGGQGSAASRMLAGEELAPSPHAPTAQPKAPPA